MQWVLRLMCAVVVVAGSGAPARAGLTFAIQPTVAEVKSSSPTEFEITYEWSVDFTPSADRRVYVHFTDANGVIRFKDEYLPDPPTSKWTKGKVKLPPRKVTVPEKLTGPFEIRMGTMDDSGNHDAIAGSSAAGELRIRVGQIKVEGDKVVFKPLTK
jgi:hypothetical protein